MLPENDKKSIEFESERKTQVKCVKQMMGMKTSAKSFEQIFGLNLSSFPDSQELLSMPQFWIADTATSVHTSPHKLGMHNWKESEQAISMGNRNIEKTTHVADILGMVCDVHGNGLE